jgi:hypothetical protein
METHIFCSSRARCAPWIETSGKTRQIETDDRPNAARGRVAQISNLLPKKITNVDMNHDIGRTQIEFI